MYIYIDAQLYPNDDQTWRPHAQHSCTKLLKQVFVDPPRASKNAKATSKPNQKIADHVFIIHLLRLLSFT